MPELVTIPNASFEITIEYASPNMKLILDRASIVDALFRVFGEWGLRLDDVEVINEGKPSEQGLVFKLPAKRTSFFFGAGRCKLSRDDSSWNTAEETIAILTASWDVVREIGHVTAGTYKTSIALHIQPKTKRFADLLKPFAPTSLLEAGEGDLTGVASVVRWNNRRITLDGSVQLANGVFLRLEREFSGHVTFLEIAEQLRKDEDHALRVLDVVEELE